MIVYQFYAVLEDYEPKIWRRLQVSKNITVAGLGYIVMTMYGLKASHLLSIGLEKPLSTFSGRQRDRNVPMKFAMRRFLIGLRRKLNT